MSNSNVYRTKDEWLAIIEEARKSGLPDAQWCRLNGINHDSFYSAIKRLRRCAYAIPEHKKQDVLDLTVSGQDVVKLNIVPEAPLQEEKLPVAKMHFDNSHMIEITIGDIHISLCNGADPVLASSMLSLLRRLA